MNVKLISITRPASGFLPDSLERAMDAESLIVYCARVSNPENQANMETSPKLIRFLIKHKHWSPFELANMCVEIKTSRAIAAQILRHRSFSFQEFSQRYSEATKLEEVQLRKPADKNRQSSSESFDNQDEVYKIANSAMISALNTYNDLIKKGVARECARMILPLGTETTMYMNGSIRSWIHYINLRTEENTQKEHREIANNIKNIFIKSFPNTSAALNWIEEKKD